MTAEQEITKLTKDLVKFRTEEGRDDEFEKALEYVEDYFSDTDLNVKKHTFDGVENLVITEADVPEVLLHGHIDVIPGDEEMYEPQEEDGKIYGRGTADMKSGVAALMKLLRDERNRTEKTLGLVIVTDEETGGFKGARKLSEIYSPEFALSAEPNNTEAYMDIITHQKGLIKLDISAEGKNAHGSRPWNGENAAEKLWEKYSEFKENFSEQKDDWGTTVNLGSFSAEGPSNIVPDHAEAKLDIRYTEKYTPEEIKKDLSNIEGLNFHVNAVDPMLDTDKDNKYVKKLKKSLEENTSEKASVTRKEPASDMRHFSEEGVPSVVFGPSGYNVHEDGEYAVKRSFGDFYSTMAEFLEKI